MQPDGHCNCLRNNNYRSAGKSPLHRVLYMNIDSARSPLANCSLSLQDTHFFSSSRVTFVPLYLEMDLIVRFMKINNFYF